MLRAGKSFNHLNHLSQNIFGLTGTFSLKLYSVLSHFMFHFIGFSISFAFALEHSAGFEKIPQIWNFSLDIARFKEILTSWNVWDCCNVHKFAFLHRLIYFLEGGFTHSPEKILSNICVCGTLDFPPSSDYACVTKYGITFFFRSWMTFTTQWGVLWKTETKFSAKFWASTPSPKLKIPTHANDNHTDNKCCQM